MKIKEPTLINTTHNAYRKVYELDIEGTKIVATYTFDNEDSDNCMWDYDLRPCYEGLSEDEIGDLEDEVAELLRNTPA